MRSQGILFLEILWLCFRGSQRLLLKKLLANQEMLVHNMIAPTFVPQISDPRITVQTFNAPVNPILPGVLP